MLRKVDFMPYRYFTVVRLRRVSLGITLLNCQTSLSHTDVTYWLKCFTFRFYVKSQLNGEYPRSRLCMRTRVREWKLQKER